MSQDIKPTYIVSCLSPDKQVKIFSNSFSAQYSNLKKIRGGNNTAESEFSNIKSEYLGEILETAFENILACLSQAQMGANYQNIWVENLVTHSL